MRREDCEIGMRVYCPNRFYGRSEFAGQFGTIVFIEPYDDIQEVKVSWDNEVRSFSPYHGHNCGGLAESGHGYNGKADDLEVAEQLIPDLIEFCCTLEDIF